MDDALLAPFDEPDRHERVAAIIRARSSNPIDIRDLALGGLALERVADALELGCGFGFMSSALAARLPVAARLIGIDACAANGPRFLARARAGGRRADFRCTRLADTLPWPAASFDLVVASYSLYFFPALVAEVARVLRPAGVFVAVTHSAAAFRELLVALGLRPERSALTALLARFSAERGEALLTTHFARIERLAYPNQLTFDAATLDELEEYTRFKLPLLGVVDQRPASAASTVAPPAAAACRSPGAELGSRLRQALVAAGGRLLINKDDAIFHAWRAGPPGPQAVRPGPDLPPALPSATGRTR